MPLKYVIFLCLSLALWPLAANSQVYYEDDGSYEYNDDDTDYNYDNNNYYDEERSDEDEPQDVYELNEQAPPRHELHRSIKNLDASSLPSHIPSRGEKFILVDPRDHVWGAYNVKGELLRWGLATAGANWCDDIDKPCRTKSGAFRVYSLGDESCISKKFPVPDGGAPMPYCMYFNGGQALHGSDEVVYGNVSHGCVRLHVNDAEWLRYHFVEAPNAYNHYKGTLVVIEPYS